MKTIQKRFWLCFLGLVTMTGMTLAQVDTLVIMHLSDTHSHLRPYGPKDSQGVGKLGGIARAATLIEQAQATEKNLLLLHAGDVFTGDLMSNKYHIVPELNFLIDMGFDALTIGNHEFDRTPVTLKRALREANFPHPDLDVLSANLDLTEEPELAQLIKPYTIQQVGNLKVGIFGLTIERTSNNFSFPAPVVVTDYLAAGQSAVDSLRSKCDIVIGLTHLGFELDSTLAVTVAGIDLVVGGHDHRVFATPRQLVNPEGKITYVIRVGCFYQYLGKLKLAYNAPGLSILDYQLLSVDSSVVSDPEVAAFVDNFTDTLQADPKYGPVYDQILAEAAVEIDEDIGSYYKDSPLGNLVTDAFRQATGTDLAIDVKGFTSQQLFKGALTGADIFQAIPYGYNANTGYGYNLVTFQLDGFHLKYGLAFTAIECQQDGDLYVQVAGMTMTYDSRLLSPMLIVKELTIGGKPYKFDSLYTITTTDGLAGFLSFAGLEPINLQETGLTEYQVVRDYIIANSPVTYTSEGRIKDLAHATAVAEPGTGPIVTTFGLNQNYPNPFAGMGNQAGTRITYYLPEGFNQNSGPVGIKVYNLLGAEVATLVTNEARPGLHSVTWQGCDNNGMEVPSGIYFYRLESGKSVLTRKLLLLR